MRSFGMIQIKIYDAGSLLLMLRLFLLKFNAFLFVSLLMLFGYFCFKVRLENIKLKNRLKKREMQLKAKVR